MAKMNRPGSVIFLLMLLAVAFWGNGDLQAQTIRQIDYEESRSFIPMRDGVKLNAWIYRNPKIAEPLPIMFMMSPYRQPEVTGRYGEGLKEIMADGYIVVMVTVRGREGSGGDYVYSRPVNTAGAATTDYTTDVYDSIEWALKTIPGHNGRVGMMGSSYRGYTTLAALIRPHPALKAAAPIVAMGDMWKGDDNFHNGAPRTSYILNWYWNSLPPRQLPAWKPASQADLYDWYRTNGSVEALEKWVPTGTLPAWDEMRANPHYNEYWQSRSMVKVIKGQMKTLTVPTLAVAGWFDQEDLYGSLETWRALKTKDMNGLLHLAVGPWYHSQWRGDGDKIGDGLSFGSATARTFKTDVLVPWFAHHLKGRHGSKTPKAFIFQNGADSWQNYERWPLTEGTEPRAYYLAANGSLGLAPDDGNRAYISDPANPVPYQPRPIRQSQWNEWMARDQRFSTGRPDVLTWQSEPLSKDVLISGDVVADLYASTTGTDADWVVKLIDVYPENAEDDGPSATDGYHLIVSTEIQRAKYARNPAKPQPVKSGVVENYKIALGLREHRFRKGHRILVQVQSSLFPLYDMNPQVFYENTLTAHRQRPRAATQRIFGRSRILLPIVQSGG
jgi:uncharacterized protein